MNTEQEIDTAEENANPLTEGEPSPDATKTTEAVEAIDPVAEVEKFRDMALRSRAELENYRKRVVREKEEAIRYANGALLESLLPVLDNFELGLSVAKGAPDAGGIVQGLEMVRKQLEDFLRAHGVETLDAENQPFDHHLHDAVAQETSATVPEGRVIRQVRRGFKLKDRLIRPATVVVSKGPPTE